MRDGLMIDKPTSRAPDRSVTKAGPGKMGTVHVLLPIEAHRRLGEIAREEDRSVAYVVRNVLLNWMASPSPKIPKAR